MLKNYLVTLLRNVRKNVSYSLINVLGLTLGMTCAVSIFLYVYDELTFDTNHANYNRIYRLNGGWHSLTDGSSNTYIGVGYIVGEHFHKDFPEIDEMVRIEWGGLNFERSGSDEHIAERIFRADTGVFNMFTLPIIAGGSGQLLPDKNSIVLTRKMAMKYFGSIDVEGKTMRSFGFDTVDWKITGVMEDYPNNTHIQMDFVVRLEPPVHATPDWFEYRERTYFTVRPNVDIKAMEERVRYFTKPYVADLEKEIGFTQEHTITPFSRIHLYSHLTGENNPQATTVYIFLTIGCFILAMACINFMNLATARSIKRAKEIGIRKSIGALKNQLVVQFMGEAFLTTVVSALLAAFAIYCLLPIINMYSGKSLQILANPVFWSMWGITIIVVAILSGSYPAFVLAAYRPSQTLKGVHRGPKNVSLRQALVVFQFVVSVSLIASTIIAFQHLDYLRSKALGFDKDQVILIRHANQATKDQLLGIAGISHASFSNIVPGQGNSGRTIVNGWEPTDPQVVVGQVAVDYDYLDLYDMKLIAGRGFDENIPADEKEAFVINEKAAGILGYPTAEAAIGGKLFLEDWGGYKGKIIGVLRDFHYNGVNSPILPFAMFIAPSARRTLSVKVSGGDLHGIIKQAEETFKRTVPNRPFEYSFLEEDFDRQYQSEDKFMSIFTFFAGVGIAIGCLGLYGLALFTTELRQKEVGVRKVFGASHGHLIVVLTSGFVKLVALSFFLAIPIAWLGMEQWLNSFPFRQKIDPLIFVTTGGAVLAITVLTISYQAIRVAWLNPATTLRNE